MNRGWTANLRRHARGLLVLAVMLLVGVVTIIAVSRNGSAPKITSVSADARFPTNVNATDSQYGVTATVDDQTTTTASSATPTGTNTTSTGTNTTGPGVQITVATPAVTLASCSAAGGTSSGADATMADKLGRSSQTVQRFAFNRTGSGDVGFFADNQEVTNDVSHPQNASVGRTATASPCGAAVFGGNSTVVHGGYDWNIPDDGGAYVSFAKFWPVDAWGRWGYELICQKQTTCHDTTQAFAADPAKIDALEPITNKAIFTIAAGHVALVHLTLNHLGGQLITQDHGELSGIVKASTVKSKKQALISGQRDFTIYYVRCAVWGKPERATQSLEHSFPQSNIGKVYGAKGLDPNACAAF